MSDLSEYAPASARLIHTQYTGKTYRTDVVTDISGQAAEQVHATTPPYLPGAPVSAGIQKHTVQESTRRCSTV